jgi:hypothetical protein
MECCRTDLPPSHAIDEVVTADDCQVNIPACRVDEMIASNGSKIAIAADYHNL